MGFRTYTCPIARECGGCEWLAVPYPIQLRRKREYVEGLLGAIAADDGAIWDEIAGMEDPRGYRHKAATPFSPAPKGRERRVGRGDARRERGIRYGFYAPGTHRIVRAEDCLVEAPGARQILADVAHVADDLRIPAYDEDRGRGVLRHAVVRMGWQTSECLLTVVANGEQLPREREFVDHMLDLHPEVTSIALNVNQRRTNAILGHTNRTLFGPGIMHDELLDCRFAIGPTSFYQTNPAQTEVLYRLAIDGAKLAPGQRLLDAYCGCGTIGICAAAATPGLEVMGVEQVDGAVGMARANARDNAVDDRCRFACADVTHWMYEHAAGRAGTGPAGTGPAGNKGVRFDVVVMDPPRAGSTPEFLDAVVALAPARVVYVSCNVETQARDLAILRAGGYRMERVSPVDMFPHTKHVENVVTLVRR